MGEDWQVEPERWLELYLDSLANKARRGMCPAYIAGLIGPGDRESIHPMAAGLTPFRMTGSIISSAKVCETAPR